MSFEEAAMKFLKSWPDRSRRTACEAQ